MNILHWLHNAMHPFDLDGIVNFVAHIGPDSFYALVRGRR